MDHASSGAPADTGWLSQVIKYAHLTALACAKNPLQARWAWVLFASLVGMLPSAAKSNAELHLPATGPTLLRFIAFSNKTNAFRWPPLMPEMKEHTLQPEPITNAPNPSLIGPLPAVEPVGDATDDPSPVITAPVSREGVPKTDLDTPGATSASELLLITPQMLAEYFQTTAAATNAPATNVPAGGAIWFTPPSLPAPGSEAVYRVR